MSEAWERSLERIRVGEEAERKRRKERREKAGRTSPSKRQLSQVDGALSSVISVLRDLGDSEFTKDAHRLRLRFRTTYPEAFGWREGR